MVFNDKCIEVNGYRMWKVCKWIYSAAGIPLKLGWGFIPEAIVRMKESVGIYI